MPKREKESSKPLMLKPIIFMLLLSTVLAYKEFKQCHPDWANDTLGVEGNHTICEAGSHLCSLAIVLNDCYGRINNTEVTPKNLNQWLKDNKGYLERNMIDKNMIRAVFKFTELVETND